MHYHLVLSVVLHAVCGDAEPLTGLSIDPETTYLIPEPYNGSVSDDFIQTTFPSARNLTQLFQRAQSLLYYSYDRDFDNILGPSPTVELVGQYPSSVAHEAGVWVESRNEVWFTAGDPPLSYSILNLDTKQVSTPTGPLQNGTNLAGGDYFDGNVYLSSMGDKSTGAPPSIHAVDVNDHSTRKVLNSYYGLPLNSIDDVSIVRAGPCRGTLFFTSLDTGAKGGNSRFPAAVLPNAVYRFSPSTKSLQGAISRGDVLAPNGVHATADSLYVSDVALIALAGPGSNSSGSPAIYKYDLDDDCRPVNKRMFALTRTYVSDGIKSDSHGRIWAAEGDGIVVRSPCGRILGVFNGLVLDTYGPIGNFALAGNNLVVLADTKLWVVSLGQNLTGGEGDGDV